MSPKIFTFLHTHTHTHTFLKKLEGRSLSPIKILIEDDSIFYHRHMLPNMVKYFIEQPLEKRVSYAQGKTKKKKKSEEKKKISGKVETLVSSYMWVRLTDFRCNFWDVHIKHLEILRWTFLSYNGIDNLRDT